MILYPLLVLSFRLICLIIFSFKKFSVIATHIIETPLSFLVFGGAYCRLLAFLLFASLNFMINISGNYGFLGLMTTIHSLSLIDSKVWVLFENYLPEYIKYFVITKYEPG